MSTTEAALTPEQQEIKDEFVRVRGTWGEPWQRMLELDPSFVRAYLHFSARPWTGETHLEPKVKEFVYIAADAAATHLYEPGVRQHIAAAFDHGATADEVMEVLELASALGIHAPTTAAPLLPEVPAERGCGDGAAPLDERRRR